MPAADLAAFGRMTLVLPSREEAAKLLSDPTTFRSYSVCAEALPPAIMLKRALTADESWSMPRLFSDDSARQIVGSGAFKSLPQESRIEIGYGISPACRRRGYATAGVQLLIHEAFSSGLIEEVYAEVSTANKPSRGVLRKIGFIFQRIVTTDEGAMELWTKRNPNQARLAAPGSRGSRDASLL
jgi:RimJ/RimL family protein N-acetyltransferase